MNTRHFTLCLLSLLLCDCATQSSQTLAPEARLGQKLASAQHDSANQLLQFGETFTRLPTEAQKKRLQETNLAVVAYSPAWLDKMKLASMLSLPNSDVRDPSKAQSILQELMQSNALTATDVAYLRLLQDINTAHLKFMQKTKDEAKNAESLHQKNESLNQKYDALQKKYDALEQKLTDLKNIEKSLSEREVKAIEKTQP